MLHVKLYRDLVRFPIVITFAEVKNIGLTKSELTGLTKFKKRKPFDLSGGERKILAFGMGLIHKPKLLLFDEPFAGIDKKNTITLLRLFKETIIKPYNIVIIVEHKDDARQLFTRKVKMELGNIKNNFQ